MKKYLALLSLTMAGLCVLPLQTMADDATSTKLAGGDGSRMSPEERLKKMSDDLGLTQDQHDMIKAIFEKYGLQMKDLIAKGRANLTADEKKKFSELRASMNDDILAALTPEQKDKYKAAQEKRHAAGATGGAAAK